MSTKLYNGYKFNKDYSLRELDEKLTVLREKMQDTALRTYMSQIINEWLYVKDCEAFFGPEVAKKRTNKYEHGAHSLEPVQLLLDIMFYFEEKIRQSKASYKRDFEYDYTCEIHIMPIKDKLLFTYYGEKEEFETLLNAQDYIEEYMYQNQTDRPENISEAEWKQREEDWSEAIIDGIPSNHGFTVELVNTNKFSFVTKDALLEIKPDFDDITKRARKVAYDIEFPCESFTFSVYCSDEYKKFIEEKTEEVKKKLLDIKNIEQLVSLMYPQYN